MQSFTDRYIRSLKPGEKVKEKREKRGFGIRIKPDGTKIFFYKYQSPTTSKRRFLSLGEYPGLSLADARRDYGKAFEAVKAGIDPLEIKQQEKEERRKADAVADLVEDYIDKHAKRFKKSWKEDERILNRDVIPAWGTRKAADITKRDVNVLLEKIVDRGAPGMANNSFQIIRKMFNFAVEKDILPYTPCFGVKLPAPKQSRDRALSEAEIRTFWPKLDSCALSDELRRALRLILITVQRPGEVIGMHTREIKGEWWVIPPERSKNKKVHRVYLTGLAREIIRQAIEKVKFVRSLPADKEYSGYVFPCPHVKKVKPIGERAMAHAVRVNLAWPILDKKGKRLFDADGKPATDNRLGIEKFTPHDLRRTAATFMAEAEERDEVIDAVMNHVKQGVKKVYIKYDYDKEKQAALEAWSLRLLGIIQAP
jgi:integrase